MTTDVTTSWLFGMSLVDRAERGPKYPDAGRGWRDVPVWLEPRRVHPRAVDRPDGFTLDIGAPAEANSDVGEIGRLLIPLDAAANMVAKMWEHLSEHQRQSIMSGARLVAIRAGKVPR